MRSRAREDVIVEQFPKWGHGCATNDGIAGSRDQVNSRARSTNQSSAASTHDLTHNLRAVKELPKPLAPCSFLMWAASRLHR
jgi:hypothetical protein